MGKRTNTASWNGKQWRIAVQKDGQRRYFYSSTQGRAGQREANAKADAWLDSGVCAKGGRVVDVGAVWLRSVELSTSADNYRPLESRWRVWVLPIIGTKKVDRLTDQDLQDVLNLAHAAGKSRKTLKSIAADMRAFCKYCRKSRISAYAPEELTIPAGARYKGKNVLQPDELAVLFSSDTTTFTPISTPIGSRSSPACARANCWACAGKMFTAAWCISPVRSMLTGKKHKARTRMLSGRLHSPPGHGACWRINGGSPAAPAACSASAQSLTTGTVGRPIAELTAFSPLRPTNCVTPSSASLKRCPRVK